MTANQVLRPEKSVVLSSASRTETPFASRIEGLLNTYNLHIVYCRLIQSLFSP